MKFTTQFGKSTTLAAQMTAAEVTSGTLAAAAFTNFTADFLVLDYDVPAKREVIKCNVTGTAIASITRAQEGTSAVQHEIGAKVMYGFLPSHYAKLTEFVGAGAYLAATIGTTTASAYTKIALDTEDYDVGANFASNKFVAPVAGYYSITAKVAFSSTVADSVKAFICAVYKNGALLQNAYTTMPVGVIVASPTLGTVRHLAATDYIELYYYHTGATTTDVVGGATETYLEVVLIKED